MQKKIRKTDLSKLNKLLAKVQKENEKFKRDMVVSYDKLHQPCTI